MDTLSKLTAENVETFITGLQNGDTQKQISEDTDISETTLSLWKQRALSDEPLRKNYLLLKPLRDFLRGHHKGSKQSQMQVALLEAATTDRVTTTEKVTEIVKLSPSLRKMLDSDLSSAFDAGEAVLIQKVTTTKTESPDPTVVIEAYQVLFPNSTGDKDDSAG